MLELATQRARKRLEGEWRSLPRGWYVGGQSFRAQLMEHLDAAGRGRQRQSRSGTARQAHDEAAAETALPRGLRLLGLANHSGQ